LVIPIIAYTFSSTKLDTRAKYFLPGSEGVREKKEGVGWLREGAGGKVGEMTQTLYVHMSKKKKKQKKKF
jgi:hypothetical protein